MARRKVNKTGRDDRGEHFTKLVRHTMETPAWRALSPVAQALYVWLKLEWRGPNANNNGRIRFSIRQAAEAMGVNSKTAARAFRDLQQHGFIVVTEAARLGLGGEAIAPAYELTELPMPGAERPVGRKLYEGWHEGKAFPVYKAAAQNPRGINGQSRVTPIRVVK